MKNSFLCSVFLLALLFCSCDRKACKNNNPIFDQYNYANNVYKKELASQIGVIGLKNLRTWLSDYVEKDGNTFLVFYIQNDSLCAKVQVKMDHWNKLENLKGKKGKGKFNAEFVNLVFTTEKAKNGNLEFVYQDLSHILD